MSSPTEQWVPKYTQNARKRLDALLCGEAVPETLIPPQEVPINEPKKIRTIQLQEDGSHSLLSDLLSFFSKKPH
jgi:hypothetical protein